MIHDKSDIVLSSSLQQWDTVCLFDHSVVLGRKLACARRDSQKLCVITAREHRSESVSDNMCMVYTPPFKIRGRKISDRQNGHSPKMMSRGKRPNIALVTLQSPVAGGDQFLESQVNPAYKSANTPSSPWAV